LLWRCPVGDRPPDTCNHSGARESGTANPLALAREQAFVRDKCFVDAGGHMRRTTMHINGRDYLLAQDQNVDVLKPSVLDALRDGGGSITTTLVGNRELDILLGTGIAITFQSEEVPDDDRDDGDLTSPIEIPEYDQWLAL
jgi:hypothetical protein